MPVKLIKKLAYLYLILPLFIFCFTWFTLLFKILLLLFLLISCYFIKIDSAKEDFYIPKKVCVLAFLVASFWCFWSGIGGYVYQTGDFLARNAIYHDLIEQDYPVYYTAGFRTLNYYFGFWLVPAMLTKIFAFIDNSEMLFTIGLNILLLHAVLGVFLFFCLLYELIKPQNRKAICLVLLFPILFSGLDILPALINNTKLDHIEVWNGIGNIQYDSQTTQLFWVFNQAIPAWIATMLFLTAQTPKNYGILFSATMFQAFLPTVGLGIFMFCTVIKYWYTSPYNAKTYRHIFSYSNLASIPIFLVLTIFFTCNTIALREHFHLNQLGLIQYFTFCFIEFGCYVLPIYLTYKHETNFKIMLFSLMTLVLFSIGGAFNDFVMRTTIPALLILQIYVLKFLLADNTSHFNKKIIYTFLAIGLITPSIEFSRGFFQIKESKSIIHRMDNWKTLNAKLSVFPWRNYLLSYPQQYKLYQYLIVPYK
jgi:hypothetical protein